MPRLQTLFVITLAATFFFAGLFFLYWVVRGIYLADYPTELLQDKKLASEIAFNWTASFALFVAALWAAIQFGWQEWKRRGDLVEAVDLSLSVEKIAEINETWLVEAQISYRNNRAYEFRVDPTRTKITIAVLKATEEFLAEYDGKYPREVEFSSVPGDFELRIEPNVESKIAIPLVLDADAVYWITLGVTSLKLVRGKYAHWEKGQGFSTLKQAIGSQVSKECI